MNGSAEMLANMINALRDVKTDNRVIICPPYTYLGAASISPFAMGAQDISEFESGAYTGQVSGRIIAETGAKYAIVGHSERRQYNGETNAVVHAKASAAIKNNLTPIICVGETMDEKESGNALAVIEQGVRESVPSCSPAIIVAYEPRWAIGAGITPTTAEIAAAHELIAKTLESMGLGGTPILYGASVKGSNAAEIMAIPNVDGCLVGGASLKPDDFLPIIMAV